ncbi:glycoside hydrolase family 31 protein [Leeuwenhoekiella parthenopeia]|uniref:Glycoside hydrolase family 31 protein n=1 Tax=Leeuwenhoekiella parthenopeia TaxID=2890320 RepID=A0ABS8GMI9_9FLAO|nr:TIM-barrel domain-containing protein [Leeuwenhoekiella parthenopeia]MCC4211185.1 glycoside hydrolase family 31 protein [Leeuwenhoekiella parthenopeia]
MKSIFLWAICSLLICGGCASKSYEVYDSGIKTQTDSLAIQIEFISPSIVRIKKYPKDRSFEKNSLSVIKEAEKVSVEVEDLENGVALKTAGLRLEFDTIAKAISFFKPDGSLLLRESTASFKPFVDNGEDTFTVGQSWNLEADEPIYGLGILQNGKMSQRNQRVEMVQNNTWDFSTFFQSPKGYGVFWDNYSPTTFNDANNETSFTSQVGDGIDYYVMAGENADEVIAEMRDLTGQVPMFPLWTYGFWQSRERYKSQEETVGVVQKHRELGVPLDGIIQDWQYWGDNYHWNAMDFGNPAFPEPQKFVNDVHDLNAHLIISIWSSFGPETPQFKELKEKNMLMDFQTWPQSGKETWPPDMNFPSGVQVYDAYDPEARDIYWNYLSKNLFSLGIDGWWMDSTEPDHLEIQDKDYNNETYLGSFRKVRNAYPLETVGGVYKHQREESSDKRVFILTRSGFAGQQRYGANVWSGDLGSSWESLRNQIPAGLNFTLTGNPNFNTDIGGFFAGAYNKSWSDGTASKNPLFQELYVRWLQYGAFTPMMRSHGTDLKREIYYFGEKGEAIYDAIQNAIELRYSLLPYIYSISSEVTHNQGSFMRALVMDFPQDKKTWDLNDEYMFGDAILVAPVLEAQYTPEKVMKVDEETGWNKGKERGEEGWPVVDFTETKSTPVYLPEGSSWYDFWTNESFEGGQEITKETTINTIPLYVKAGSILSKGPDVQYAEEKSWDNLEIRVYEGANGSFSLYEDEFDNYNYENGAYSTISFTWDDAVKTLKIADRKGEFDGMLQDRKFTVVKIGKDGAVSDAQTVAYSGAAIEVTF